MRQSNGSAWSSQLYEVADVHRSLPKIPIWLLLLFWSLMSCVPWYVPHLLKKEEKDHRAVFNGGICTPFKQGNLEWLFQQKIGKIVDRNRRLQLVRKSRLSVSRADRFNLASSLSGRNTLVSFPWTAPSTCRRIIFDFRFARLKRLSRGQRRRPMRRSLPRCILDNGNSSTNCG